MTDHDDHRYEEARFYDPVKGEWGYEIICTNENHVGVCPGEKEMFRIKPDRTL